ncbi:hypothetical protein AB3G45_07875 [Shinella sp. S4-D37]|uniref:hypothetical protein n=1 Tax=Shinella sp. S4-D37 TaxID=3161999 RepID=UPI0034671D26
MSHYVVRPKVDRWGLVYQQDTGAARAVHETVQIGYFDEFLGSLIGTGTNEERDELVEHGTDPLIEAIKAYRAASSNSIVSRKKTTMMTVGMNTVKPHMCRGSINWTRGIRA